jgi:hypothetical protein
MQEGVSSDATVGGGKGSGVLAFGKGEGVKAWGIFWN